MDQKISASDPARGQHEAEPAVLPNGDYNDGDEGPAIAIVGMATRLCGGITSPEELWKFLIEGKNGLCEIPGTRYNIDSFYGPGKPESVKTRKGYFLQHDPALLDSEFFGIHPIEVEKMDPQQKQLLEVTVECMESAGETELRGSNIGCYVGVFGEDWIGMASQDPQSMDRYHVSSTGLFALANRLSYQFDWHGPSMTIQTACSSSMVSLHEGCQALLRNDCTAAVVAGVNLILNPAMTIGMSDSKVLSADGACKTFDESADGYGRGEGISVVLLKRLKDALRDGDSIRAVIRGTHTNHDGKTTTSFGPDVKGQEDLINTAYLRAGINDIDQTPFFECHGTGTPVGDVVEVSAITRVLRQSSLSDHEPKDITVIGSIKPNVGHTEGASGLTSVIKAVLSLEHGTIPPNAFFKAYNSKASFQEAKLLVPQKAMPFPDGRKKRVSVNCFGVGGSNSHAILESAEFYLRSARGCSAGPLSDDAKPSNKRYLIVLSSKSADALERRIASLIDYLKMPEACSMQDLSYTLCCRRKHYMYRAFAVANSHRPLTRLDFRTAHVRSAVPVWLFTGQGAQWAGMARQLLETSSQFREDMLHLEAALKALPDAPAWSIIEELGKPTAQESRVNETEISQPLSTAIAIGLTNHLRRLNLKPAAIIGHSSGELAAAYASGAITAASAIVLAYFRGIVSKSREGKGAMASIGLGCAEIAPFLDGFSDITVACKNSPRNTVLSGNAATLEQVVSSIKLEHKEVFCRTLRVSVAYHSSQMEEASALYKSMISSHIHHNDTMVPMYSTSTRATIADPRKLDPEYWRHGLASPVQFADAVADAILDHRDSQLVFVEIGPNSTFSSLLRQIAEPMGLDEDCIPIYVPTLTRNDPDSISQLLHTVGRLHCLGTDLDMPNVTGRGKVLSNLPAYPWKHQLLQRESRLTHEWRHRKAPHHELLGSRIPVMPESEPAWRNLIQLGDVIWMGDHKIDGKVIFPVAGYVAMAGAACMQLRSGAVAYELRALALTSFLVIRPGKQTEILTSLKKHRYNDLAESDWYSFTICSHDGTSWTQHCHGQARAVDYGLPPDQGQLGALPQSYARQVNLTEWYKHTRRRGFDYGQSFRSLAQVSADPAQFAAKGTLNENAWLLDEDTKYPAHPTDIDRCIQLMGIAFGHGLHRRIGVLQVPQSIGSIFVSTRQSSAVYVRGTDDGHRGLSWQANAVSDQGIVSYIRELRSVALDKAVQPAESTPQLASLKWQPLLDLLPPGKLLLPSEKLDEAHRQHPWSRFFGLITHAQPKLRVLEVGTASPDSTRSNLRYFKSSQGTMMFSSYTLASSSTVALDRARIEFNDDPNISFKVLDTHSNILNQAVEPHTFDLILTSEADHLLSPQSLSTLRQLVTPRGWLLFQNADFVKKCQNESFVQSWCKDRINETYAESLKAAGFELAQAQVGNQPQSEACSTSKLTLLASAASAPQHLTKEVMLLTGDNLEIYNEMFAEEFSKRGYTVTWSTLSTLPAAGQNIISLLDLNGPTIAELTEASFQQLKTYLIDGQPKHMLWLTRPAQHQCHDPRYGLTHGLVRTLRHEHAVDMSVAEILSVDATVIELLVQLQNWIAQFDKSSHQQRDFEFFVDEAVHVGRYHWLNILPAVQDSSARQHTPMKLHLESNGLLQSSSWVQTNETTLKKDEVRVEIRYVGLNFRDIMVAMGLVGTKSQIGLEASGIVCEVGTDVTGFLIGDRVGLVGSGLCQTCINVPARTCWKIPESLSMEVAASTLVPFLTALYSLTYAGNLKKGQSVLIQSACGGVGLAAVQVSQLIGANIYATVGSDSKTEYLSTNYLLPKDQIFCSRDDSFWPNLIRATEGKGADVVLNSLAGKLLHASWNCVAKFGKMIELGKIDFSTNGSLDMGPFAGNRSFVGVDLLQLASELPELLSRLIDELAGYFQAGQLNPLPIQRIYDVPEVMDALRQMQKGQHIGKYVVRIPSSNDQLQVSSVSCSPKFPSNASYILAGGLGGLGRAVSNWMAENGARELVFLSRSAGKPSEHDGFLHELSVQGCKAICIAGSVTNPADVGRAVAACSFPLRGVLQLSAALHDRTFRNMTYKEWTDCLDPKVVGTWNLHEATKDSQDVDFFVLFGSLAGVYGNSGQANYAAGNTYLESFVHYRRNLGLPCSLLNLGPVEEVGMISRDDKLLQALKVTSCKLLSEEDVCEGLGMAIVQSKAPIPSDPGPAATESTPSSCAGIINLGLSTTAEPSEPSPRSSWTSEARFSLYANLKPTKSNKPQFVDDKFRAFVDKIEADPSILNESQTELIICREIARLMTGYLADEGEIKDEDVGNIAIDSLMAIEIKDWVRGNMNLDVSMDQTSRARTSGQLASVTLERLKVKYGLLQ